MDTGLDQALLFSGSPSSRRRNVGLVRQNSALRRLSSTGIGVCDDLEVLLSQQHEQIGPMPRSRSFDEILASSPRKAATVEPGQADEAGFALPFPMSAPPVREADGPGQASDGGTALGQAMARAPGVLIGSTMNIMLCVPFGLAFFPETWEPFPFPRAIGLQMFLFSTLICQVVMTVGSGFPCAMGMMMVENIPFMHTLAQSITSVQGTGVEAMATTMTAFALSTVAMGLCFMALGKYQLGRAVSYFPRHFLIGCIGGIGIFVTQTGVEVSSGVPWSWTMAGVAKYGSPEVLPLWLVTVVLVVILNVLLRFVRWPLLPPFYFVGIIPFFYTVLLLLGVSPDAARNGDWLFSHPPTTDASILFSVFDFTVVRWDLILQQMPTIVALTCFGLMHAPINIPSLSMSTSTEVDMNRELVVHGWSNLLSGCLGGLPNYLCYSNSLLYVKCGGGGRTSGCVLCAILVACLSVGPGAIAYVPRCMAGCLLIHVGLDLMREALVDSLEGFDTFEYTCVLVITITMTMMGMTQGLFVGFLLSAVSFTLQHMRHCDPVRGVMPAATLRSSSRRSREERDVLQDALHFVRVVQLQGTLFFGNATVLSSRCEEMLLEAKGYIFVLILDFTLVRSLESSASETIAKIYSVARRHGAALVFNRGSTDGFPTSAPLSSRLAKLEQSGDEGIGLHVSDDLDEALAWTEDLILSRARQSGRLPVRPMAVTEENDQGTLLPEQQLQALCPPEDAKMATRLLAHMRKRKVKSGETIWRQGDLSDFCLLLSEGLLENNLENEAGTAEESNPGDLIGEFHFLNGEKRMHTLSAKKDSVVYVLDATQLEQILKAEPYLAFVLARISIMYLGLRCQNVANRIWDTRCLPI